MKATILAIVITFAGAGVVAPEAEAQSRKRSYKKARRHRTNVRTPRRVRRPTRHYRKPARRHYRKPARRHYRKPARRHYRKPARRHYRKPARRHYRRPARRYYRPAYRSAVKTVTLTNSQSYGIRVAVRAGHSSVCSANPVQSRQFLAPGTSMSVSTYGSYVCYRQLPTRYTSGTAWYRAVVSVRFSRLWF